MCEITRIHYLDCPHIARIVSKFCKPYLNGPQDRSCAQLNNTDAEVRPSHCKRSGCKPKVTTLWVEAGTFVTDDNFPIIQSLQQLKIAIRKRPVEEKTEK